MKRFESVDAYVADLECFQDEVQRLREILNSTRLDETLKWSMPVYTFGGANLVGIGAFSGYFGLWFYQGALLRDDAGLLMNAQEGKTKAMRQWRMRSAKEIKVRTIKAYVKEAIELQQSGKSIKADRGKPLLLPQQLADALDQNKKAQSAFNKLTIGKQREFADYITEAKREDTKARRLAKVMPMIVQGVGLNDKYR